ncbi:MAG: SPOR domain-containing protein [Alphaproteobacteria bacterium]|nr:SPOR domain-containing protein [Alphaproteobacteria bacterium]
MRQGAIDIASIERRPVPSYRPDKRGREEKKDLISDFFYIQAGSFRDPEIANQLASSLEMTRQPVKIVPVDISGTTYYRVFVGPVQNRHDAEDVLQTAWSSGAKGAYFVNKDQ